MSRKRNSLPVNPAHVEETLEETNTYYSTSMGSKRKMRLTWYFFTANILLFLLVLSLIPLL